MILRYKYLTIIVAYCLLFASCTAQKTEVPKLPSESKSINQVNGSIWNIYQDQNANYWFGSRKNGIYFYDGKTIKQFTKEDGLFDNQITGIQEDHLGNIYIESARGVAKFNGTEFIKIEIAEDAFLKSNWILNTTDLWFKIGFNDNGPYRYDGKKLHKLKLTKSPQENRFYKNNLNSSFSPYSLYSIYKDKNGHLWFGTSSVGVCRYDGTSFAWYYEDQLQTTEGGGDFGTRAIIQDQNNRYWINNTRNRYDLLSVESNNIIFNKSPGVENQNNQLGAQYPFFLTIDEDRKGNLWMATYDSGVYMYNGSTLIHIPVTYNNQEVLLFKIYVDQNDMVWVGSHDQGVYYYNGVSFERFVP